MHHTIGRWPLITLSLLIIFGLAHTRISRAQELPLTITAQQDGELQVTVFGTLRSELVTQANQVQIWVAATPGADTPSRVLPAEAVFKAPFAVSRSGALSVVVRVQNRQTGAVLAEAQTSVTVSALPSPEPFATPAPAPSDPIQPPLSLRAKQLGPLTVAVAGDIRADLAAEQNGQPTRLLLWIDTTPGVDPADGSFPASASFLTSLSVPAPGTFVVRAQVQDEQTGAVLAEQQTTVSVTDLPEPTPTPTLPSDEALTPPDQPITLTVLQRGRNAVLVRGSVQGNLAGSKYELALWTTGETSGSAPVMTLASPRRFEAVLPVADARQVVVQAQVRDRASGTVQTQTQVLALPNQIALPLLLR